MNAPANAAVWFEIPVTDMKRSMAFYAEVLGNELRLDETGPNPMAIFAAKDDARSPAISIRASPLREDPGRPSTSRWRRRSKRRLSA